MGKKKLEYCDPNVTYYHKLAAFFESDPDIEIGDITEDDNENYHFSVVIHDYVKYCLFAKIIEIPKYCERLYMDLECDTIDKGLKHENIEYLLKDNALYSRFIGHDEEGAEENRPLMDFFLMKPETVQYYNDVFNNPYQMETVTAETLVKEVLRGTHHNFTSDLK